MKKLVYLLLLAFMASCTNRVQEVTTTETGVSLVDTLHKQEVGNEEPLWKKRGVIPLKEGVVEGQYRDEYWYIHAQTLENGDLYEKVEVFDYGIRGYNKLGSQKYSGTFINGEKNGEFKYFTTYTNTKDISRIENYKNGKKNGIVKEFQPYGYTDNKIIYEGNYSDDQKHGTFKYYINQNITSIENYNYGKLDGKQVSYREHNVTPYGSYRKYKTKVENYKDGQLNGEQRYYFDSYHDIEHSIIWKIENYENGIKNGEQKIFFKPEKQNDTIGNVSEFTNYTKGKLNGIQLKYQSYPSHRVELERNWKDNKLHGKVISYSPYGQINYLESGEYIEGIRQN